MRITRHSPQKILFLILLLLFFSACAGVERRPEGIFQREQEELTQIEKYSSYVRVEGDSLYLKLKSGTEVKFTNVSGQYIYKHHELLDYYIEQGFYHLRIDAHEDAEFPMVSDKTGELFQVHNRAHFSPDRKRFVTVVSGDAYGIGGLFVWRFEEDKIISEVSNVRKDYDVYDFIEWKDNETILLTKRDLFKKENCPGAFFFTFPVTLKLNNGVWTFYDDLSALKSKCDDK